jgi:hypothetical protein
LNIRVVVVKIIIPHTNTVNIFTNTELGLPVHVREKEVEINKEVT